MAQLRTAAYKAEAAREELTQQLVDAYQQMAALREAAAGVPALEADITALHDRLDLAMEALGERNTRVAELEDDVQDMKVLFRDQLDEAMRQLEDARQCRASSRSAVS